MTIEQCRESVSPRAPTRTVRIAALYQHGNQFVNRLAPMQGVEEKLSARLFPTTETGTQSGAKEADPKEAAGHDQRAARFRSDRDRRQDV